MDRYSVTIQKINMKTKQEEIEYLEFRIENFTGGCYPKPDTENYSEINVKIIITDEEDDEKVIGKMKAVLLYACDAEDVYEALDNYSINSAILIEGLYNELTDEYQLPDKWDEYDYNRFIAICEIEIDKEYRGLGIAGRLINWLDKVFCVPMLLYASPLQDKRTAQSIKKVVQAYIKCGFERTKPKSNVLYKMPNYNL